MHPAPSYGSFTRTSYCEGLQAPAPGPNTSCVSPTSAVLQSAKLSAGGSNQSGHCSLSAYCGPSAAISPLGVLREFPHESSQQLYVVKHWRSAH